MNKPTTNSLNAAMLFAWLLPILLLFVRVVADATVVLSGLVFLYWSYKNASWQWAKTTWFRLFLLFWAYLLIVNTWLSLDPAASFKAGVAFMRWPLFAIALSVLFLKDDEYKKAFIKSLMVVTVFVFLDTYWQYLWGLDWFGYEKLNDDRLTGPFRKPVPGTYMLRVWFILAFAIYFFSYFSNHSKQLLYIFAILLLGMGFIFITGERMAFMLFMLGVATCLTAVMVAFREERKIIMTGSVVLTVALIGMAILVPDTAERTLWSIIDKLTHFIDSDYGHVFNAAYQAWLENPMLGSGLHTYRAVCEQMGILPQLASDMECTHPHNLYLHLAAETGVVGLILFVVVLAALYTHVLKPLLTQQAWLQAALCFSILTASFWPLTGGISVMSNWVAALVWLGVGWCLAISSSFQQAHLVTEGRSN